MDVSIELRETQHQIDALLARPNLSESEQTKANLLMAKLKTLRGDQERCERARALVKELGLPLSGDAVRSEERDAFAHYLKTGEHRTYTAMSDSVEGAFVVPADFYGNLLKGIAQYTELLDENSVRLITSTKGGAMTLPQVDLSSISSSIVTENADAPPVANPVFGSLSLGGDFVYRTNPIAVSIALEQDSFEPIINVLTEAFSTGLARGIGADLVNGNGTSAPQGILTAAADSGVTSASVGSFGKSELEQIYFTVDRAYRVSPKAAWLMNDATYKQISQLTDTNGRPLLNIVDDQERLFGKRVLISPNMPTANGSKAVLFGDLGQYCVRIIRNGVAVRRNFQAANYVEKGAVLYTGFMRVDAALNAPNGAKPVVYGTLHP